MKFPQNVKSIIEQLEAAGYEAYAVGGCVRDSLSGLIPPDYDIAASAVPEEIKQVFSDYKLVDIGEKHGTIAVIIKDEKIEITSFRSDGEYTDNRHPDNVTFVRDLKSDLSRRDFTVNAMAYSERTGLIDLFEGEKDLKKGILKCVGEPEKRFTEDALRIMRALRFMSERGFKPDEQTEKALRNLKSRLIKIAPERIAVELDRLLLGDFAEEIILNYYDVLNVIIPELEAIVGFNQCSKYHAYDVLTHTAKVVSAIPKNRVLRLTALLHDIAKPECFTLKNGAGHFGGHDVRGAETASKILRRLRYDNATRNRIKLLIENHDERFENDSINVKKVLNKLGFEALEQLCALQKADDSAKADFVAEMKKNCYDYIEKAREIVEKNECYTLAQLAINGSDLIPLGFEGGEIGNKLQELLDLVINEKVQNDKAELLEHVQVRSFAPATKQNEI